MAVVAVSLLALTAVVAAASDDSCPYFKSRSSLSGYETGGPYTLAHPKMTKDRMDLREFLWNHWHGRVKGVAEAADGETFTALYVIQPDSKGNWGVDVEINRPQTGLPCRAFHVESLARIPIPKPEDDPSQTLTLNLPFGRIPETHLADSEVKDAKYYRLVFVANERMIGDTI